MEARLSFYVYIYINFVADDKREEGGKKASIIQRYGRKRRRTRIEARPSRILRDVDKRDVTNEFHGRE